MSFVDIRFLFFFPAVVLGNFLLPERFRWAWLLVASYFFYMLWRPEYALMLLFITALDYFAGLGMGIDRHPHRRKLYLAASLIGNLGILFIFKYFNFFFDSLGALLHAVGSGATLPTLSLLLPIGISFHIFQSLSYTIDVYKKKFEPVRHFGKFALYVSFFPQLVAGPIERPSELLTQFFEARRFNLEKARRGALLMLWGFYKKVAIADNLAPMVNAVYASPSSFSGPSLILATMLFAYQLYCDFSGYTDIARGAANILGYDLVKNFDRPYISTSVAEFWRRWHISLSSWLRDYLYYPLAFAGKEVTPLRLYASLFITFVLIGLWHGAAWTYVIMGALFGMYLVVGSVTQRWRERVFSLPTWLKRGIVFALVCIAWIFFRAPSLSEAWYIVSHLLARIPEFTASLTSASGIMTAVLMGAPLFTSLVGILGIVAVEGGEALWARGTLTQLYAKLPPRAPLLACAAAVFVLLIIGAFSASQQFIYFQF